VYEQRLETCGLIGWTKVGILGRGHVSAVSLRITPCGLHVAMKATHSAVAQLGVNIDCSVLEMLMRYQNDPRCNACFPKYYFLSKYTGVCYAEYVASVPIAVYFDHINANSTAGFQHVRKAFVEGLGALSVLQDAGVKHRDLTFRNMLIRLPSSDSKEYKVVFVDFGGSQTKQFGVVPNVRAIVLGGHGRSDLFSFTCGYIKYFYPQYPWCKSLRQYNIPVVGEPSSFIRFLTDLLRIAKTKDITPNYSAILSSFESVETL
jgi:serine/threonine protein kinase